MLGKINSRRLIINALVGDIEDVTPIRRPICELHVENFSVIFPTCVHNYTVWYITMYEGQGFLGCLKWRTTHTKPNSLRSTFTYDKHSVSLTVIFKTYKPKLQISFTKFTSLESISDHFQVFRGALSSVLWTSCGRGPYFKNHCTRQINWQTHCLIIINLVIPRQNVFVAVKVSYGFFMSVHFIISLGLRLVAHNLSVWSGMCLINYRFDIS